MRKREILHVPTSEDVARRRREEASKPTTQVSSGKFNLNVSKEAKETLYAVGKWLAIIALTVLAVIMFFLLVLGFASGIWVAMTFPGLVVLFIIFVFWVICPCLKGSRRDEQLLAE